MALTSFRFFLFLLVLFTLYFAVPKNRQWVVLLAGSLFFYTLTGWRNLIFILITSCSAWYAGLWMERVRKEGADKLKEEKDTLTKEEKKARKKKIQDTCRHIMTGAMVLNFGLLCVFKYTNFVIEQLNTLLRMGGLPGLSLLKLMIPLGISFYTFQTMGYVADVYWEKTEAQKSMPRMLLFTSFFPQITQGPISNYRQLSEQLFAEHDFSYEKFARGVQRFMWGLSKKMILADVTAGYVKDVFTNYREYAGIAVLLGAFMYSVQIYADFSGYMDMVCGLCETMGITLTENFMRPYFSKSVEEYWQRWHISLGAWFKNYIYFPVACSKLARNAGKYCKEKFGKQFGKHIPATIALVVTWFATGFWHGASWAYIVWGGVNGLFIIMTLWLKPFYVRCTEFFHIRTESRIWQGFQVLRTFLLVTLIKVLPEVGTLRQGLGLWKRIFTDFTIPRNIHQLLPFMGDDLLNFLIVVCMILLVLTVSLLQRKQEVRVYFNKLPAVVRVFVLAGVFVLCFAVSGRINAVSGEFLYANF